MPWKIVLTRLFRGIIFSAYWVQKIYFMDRFARSAEILYDLLHIQHERTSVYEKLLQYPGQDESVCKCLHEIAQFSRDSMYELRGHMDVHCGDPADRVQVKGPIYRKWPGTKQLLPGSSPADILQYCEYNEKQAVLAYQEAIAWEEWEEEMRDLLTQQLKHLRQSSRLLNKCREKPIAPVSASVERISFSRNRIAEGAWMEG
jgi:uncharacterized protein (TIGR02284 family)